VPDGLEPEDGEEQEPLHLSPLLRSDQFSQHFFPDRALRDYQAAPAQTIFDSICLRRGEQHVVVFSRQAGKDELLAQLLCQILMLFSGHGGTVLVVAPTLRPQGATSRERLLDRLRDVDPVAQLRSRDGHIVQFGKATARFLSASPLANARGQTADLLLVANEAQDIRPEIWDAVFDPMAATTNATTVFMGTVWSRHTLLARQMRYLEAARDDRAGRVWKVTWEEVARHLPAYGERVRARIEQMGADHPAIRTEYLLEELDDAGALFTEQAIAQMQGDHPRQHRATPGRRHALLIDVAGESETPAGPGMADWSARRDSTAVTVIEICPPEGGIASYGQLPLYRVVDRLAWTGIGHAALHGRIADLARHVWKASVVVVDGTGIGAGLASFLKAELGRRSGASPAIAVVPFQFTSQSKSRLGWDFLGLIEAGRYKEYVETAPAGSEEARQTEAFWAQLRSIQYEVLPGPGTLMRWSAPAGRGHEDLVVSAAMAALLDQHDFRPRIARGYD
jgi:hypothetical protein